ncbi:MAG: ABC transporter substrate-binding protein [Arachnia sp.]
MARKIVKRLGVAGVALAASTSLMLTACGQRVNQPASSSQATQAATTTEFSYWSSWSEGEPQQQVIAGIISDFEAETGIAVDVRWLGREYVTTVNNANAVGDGPDLYDNATDHIADFRSREGIGDIEAVLDLEVPGEGVTVGDVLPPAVIQASSDAEGLGMIPYVTISTSMWFDAAAHPEWVDSPPQSVDELITSFGDLREAGMTPVAQDGTVNFYNAYWIYWLLMRHGGPGTLSGLGESPENWDDPAVLAAAQDLQRIVDAEPFQADFMGTTYPAAQNAWANGEMALNLNGSWLASEVGPNAPEGFEPSTFAFPMVPGGSDTVEVGAQGWTINAEAPNAGAAAEFLAFALQASYQQEYTDQTSSMAAREGIDAPPALVTLQQRIQEATTVNATYDSAPAQHAGWWNDVFLPLSDKLISGQIDAATFVADGKAATADYQG